MSLFVHMEQNLIMVIGFYGQVIVHVGHEDAKVIGQLSPSLVESVVVRVLIVA